jgi:hypothetical protein
MESNSEIQTQHNNSIIRKLLDSPFWMLAISLAIVFTSYTIWGLIELLNLKPGVLP